MTALEVASYDEFWKELEDAGNKLVVVQFYSDTCDRCRSVVDLFNQLIVKNRHVLFLKAHYKRIQRLQVALNVLETPTFVLFKNSKEVDRVNYDRIGDLERKIRDIAGVDKLNLDYQDYVKNLSDADITDLSDLQFKLIEAGKNLVVVQFYVEWSRPCQVVVDLVNHLCRKYPSKIIYYRVNAELFRNIADAYYITIFPTFVFFRNCKEIKRIYGAQEREIENFVENFIADSRYELEDSLVSHIEKTILNARRPPEFNETELRTINGETGIWVNKTEEKEWQSILPLIHEYHIHKDAEPEIVHKVNESIIEYEKEISYRYLRPPTPPEHGEILIVEEKNTEPPAAPPLIIRQTAARALTPPPIIIREKPPTPPERLPQQIITIPGKQIEPPPRKVIIEKLAQPPPKPAPVIIERWLPYEPQKRKVIFQKREPDPEIEPPKNVIIQWQTPKSNVTTLYKDLGVEKCNPEDYLRSYGDLLKKPEEITEKFPELPVVELKPTPQVVLEGDVDYLNIIDLEREGLRDYKTLIPLYDSVESIAKRSVDANKANLFVLPDADN